MPNRILKETICTSPSIEQLGWFEEVCFYRLLVQADDYGRLDARPMILLSRLFPLRDDITCRQITDALVTLEDQDMVARYIADDRPYLEICHWSDHQRVRNKRSKCPSPPWAVENHVENEADFSTFAPSALVRSDTDKEKDTDSDTD